MKKLFLTVTAAVAIVAMAACSGKKAEATETTTDATETGVKAAYTGILPAADCDGIWYTLQINDGKYDMIETYFALDTAEVSGINELLSVKSEGAAETVQKGAYSYIKLTPSTQDATMCFLNATDSTLIMLNSDLETPTAPELYTLNIVK